MPIEKPRKPSEQQQTEWFESPTTEYFFSLISALKQRTKEQLMDQGFDTTSAEQLQAMRGHLWGFRNALEDVEEVFESQSFSQWEEDDEQVGDTRLGGPSVDSAGRDRKND